MLNNSHVMKCKEYFVTNIIFLKKLQLIIDEENSITLTGSEFLGVTYESGVGLLSLEFTDSGVTYFRNIPNPSFDSSEPMFPLVGNTYTFADVHIPSILSIGAVIEEGKFYCIHLILLIPRC